jgi:small subunit ribosomal protein S3e
VVQKRFNFPEGTVELYAEKVNNRGLCAIAQAESLRYKLLGGLAVRRACYGVLRFIMESGAKGCEVRRWRLLIFAYAALNAFCCAQGAGFLF